MIFINYIILMDEIKEMLIEIIKRLDKIEEKLNNIDTKQEEIKDSTNNMDNHIQFVENVYDTIKQEINHRWFMERSSEEDFMERSKEELEKADALQEQAIAKLVDAHSHSYEMYCNVVVSEEDKKELACQLSNFLLENGWV
jgi:septal ring factor EnvC (AmiA/AmiB activator)